jgi:hypothetical protein
MIGRHILLVRLVLDMVRDGDRIETLLPRLVHAYRGPDQTVREDRVHVEITFEGLVSHNIGNMKFPPDLGETNGGRQQKDEEAQHDTPGAQRGVHGETLSSNQNPTTVPSRHESRMPTIPYPARTRNPLVAAGLPWCKTSFVGASGLLSC